MFDIGFWEIVLIGVVGLVVIGPERLPEVARTLGVWVGRTRRFINQVKADVGAELKQEELRKAIENNVGLDEIKQIMNTDHFTLEDEDYSEPDYQVKAIDDEPSVSEAKTATKKTTQTPENKITASEVKAVDDEPSPARAEAPTTENTQIPDDRHTESEVRAIDDEPTPAKAEAPTTKTTETPVTHEPKA